MSREKLKNDVFMVIAAQLAVLGTCDRKQVGAVVVKRGRCISWGYNGAPPGLPHCSENNHGWTVDRVAGKAYKDSSGRWRDILSDGFYIPGNPNKAEDILNRLAAHLGCLNATHAEANALAAAAAQGISVARSTLYVTVSPCETCSRLLIAANIDRVVYLEEYRDARGRELLVEAGVVCQAL